MGHPVYCRCNESVMWAWSGQKPTNSLCVRFEVLTALLLKMQVLRPVTMWWWARTSCFEGTRIISVVRNNLPKDQRHIVTTPCIFRYEAGTVKITDICCVMLCSLVRGKLSYLAPLGSENISAPYFKQCFFRGGDYPPDWVKHHASQSQDRNNKYFILYIEFCINNKI